MWPDPSLGSHEYEFLQAAESKVANADSELEQVQDHQKREELIEVDLRDE